MLGILGALGGAKGRVKPIEFTFFKGMLFKNKLPRKSKAHMIILSDYMRFYSGFEIHGYKKIETEDPVFNDTFDVFVPKNTPLEDVFYILTPRYMSELKSFHDKYNDFAVNIYENDIIMAIPDMPYLWPNEATYFEKEPSEEEKKEYKKLFKERLVKQMEIQNFLSDETHFLGAEKAVYGRHKTEPENIE